MTIGAGVIDIEVCVMIIRTKSTDTRMCAITIRTEISSIGTNAVAIYTETIDSGNVLRISAQNNRTTVQIHWTVNSQGMPRHL